MPNSVCRGIMGTRGVLAACAALALWLAVALSPACAVPALQLYIPGATWDADTQTWVTTDTDFDLWVVGCNSAFGGTETINDVFLAAALMPQGSTNTGAGTITITPVLPPYAAYPPYAPEPSVTAFGAGGQSGWFYGTPTMGNGQPLPPHDVYDTSYLTFDMGDFNPLYTVYDMQPGETGQGPGEYKKVHVSITGFDWVHFDAYNHFIHNDRVHARFAPFSHDAEHSPEPGSLLLMGSGLAGLVGVRFRGRRARRVT